MRKRRIILFCSAILVVLLFLILVWNKLQAYNKSPSEQITDYLVSNIAQDTADVKLFSSDLFETYGIIGFQELESNKVGIATFRFTDDAIQLDKCTFSENLVKRATDIYIDYYNWTNEYDEIERKLLVLINRSDVAKLIALSGGKETLISIDSSPSIVVVSIPNNSSEFIYSFYDIYDNKIE